MMGLVDVSLEGLNLLTVLQYGYAFHAFSSIVSDPFGAIILMKLGTRDSR